MSISDLAVRVSADVENFRQGMGKVDSQLGAWGNKMQSLGRSVSGVGKNLTRYITAPVVAAATAAAGLVATLGWKRLVAIDSAKAQLEGFGYSLKDVERISEQVNRAVTGTVMTMAEGTSVAAGALAAGVKEGAELEAYIKRVGNAAVGANRPVEEMAMIFNRVQGGGRLMTRELNMIEQGMPGFSMTMAEHLGVPLAEFRKMVTGGKVSAAEFMAVMDDFAGDMADAYANTWEGMVANTKSNIGIIGQNLLSGVFEQSKESIGEFLELLRSDEAKEWAKETGAKIADTFANVVEWVKDAVKWWGDLDDGTKGLIKNIAIAVVAAGPVLKVIGGIITAAGTVAKVIKGVGVAIKGVGAAVTFLTSPVGLIILAIVALIAIGVLLYKNWDKIKDFAIKIWGVISDFFSKTWEDIKGFFSDTWESITSGIESAWQGIKDFFTDTWKSIVKGVSDAINSFVNFFASLPSRVWEWLVKTVNNVITWAGNVRTNAVKAGKEMLNSFIDEIKGLPSKLWNVLLDAANTLLNIGGQLWNNAKRVASNLWEGFKKGLGIASPSFIERAMDDIADRAKDLPGELRSEFDRLKNIGLPSFQTGASLDLSHAQVQPLSRMHDTREVRLLIDLKNIPAHMDQGTLTEALRQAIRGGGIDRDLDEAGARSRRMVIAPQGGY